jgi:hypothetical protein
MSYCTPVWISDYTYEGLMNARTAPVAATAPPVVSPLCDCLIVWGSVEGDSVHLNPSFVARTRTALPDRRGPASVIGEGRDGRQLFRYEFEPAELDHAPNIRHFTFAVPLEESARRALDRITVRSSGRSAVIRPRGVLAGLSAEVALARAAVDVRRVGVEDTEVRWDTTAAPVVVIRDPATARILGIATTGRVVVRAPSAELELALSDGITSTVTRVRAPRR